MTSGLEFIYMGMTRFFLALSVVLFHTGAQKMLVGGVIAIQVFYIFSGFYMSLILSTKYNKINPF